MVEGYDLTPNCNCIPTSFDELLCEYVDGAMDSIVKQAFEDYLAADRGLQQQVRQLRNTRKLLCKHRCRGTQDLCARMQQRLAQKMAETDGASTQSHGISGMVVTVAMVGFLIPTTWFEMPQHYPACSAASPLMEESTSLMRHASRLTMLQPVSTQD